MEKIRSFIFTRVTVTGWLLIASVLSVGLFNEYLSCAASIVLCIYIFILMRKNKKLVFVHGLPAFAVMIIPLFYLVSILWAVDAGMAFLGFLKFLPLPLFMVVVMQQKESADKYLEALPIAGVIMTVVSGIVMLFSPKNYIFAPVGRMAGFMQYPNTFALVLLVCLIVTATKKKLDKFDYVCFPIFIAGIVLSGSRAVFVLMIIAVIVLIFTSGSKKIKLTLLAVTGAAILIAAVYTIATGNLDSIGRFLSISFKRSTFQGRLLYYTDSLPVVLRNPFGTGYLGFYYLQQSFQTGLYSVRYVHNDILQLALDIGWIPVVLLMWAAVKSFVKKGASLRKRLLLIFMTAHCCFDMDFQFVSVFMIYILLLDVDVGKKTVVRSQTIYKAGFAVIGCISLYMGTALTAARFKLDSFSHMLYPWDTDVNIRMLTDEEDAEKMDKKADEIIAQNKYVTVAYSAKASCAFSKGDLNKMIEYKDKAIENAPLIGEEYMDYIRMLLIAEQMLLESGDRNSALFCDNKIRSVLNDLEHIGDKLSTFGKNINDQPETEIPDELKEILVANGFIK